MGRHPQLSTTALSAFNSILKRDATDTTYKYALLRALVEVVDEGEHHVVERTGAFVRYPLGLVIEKWIYYYYPIVRDGLPQRNGADPADPTAKQIAFRGELTEVVRRYESGLGFGGFVQEFRHDRLTGAGEWFLPLLRQLSATIRRYPMKHLGFSYFQDHYAVVWPGNDHGRLGRPGASEPLGPLFLIERFGTFCLRRDFYELFKVLGGFLNGTDAVIYQWAQFTAQAVRGADVTVHDALGTILEPPERSRNVADAARLYRGRLRDGGPLHCVWSGKRLAESTLAVDHVIPFSLWGNNDLWNLLPAHSKVNGRKRDRVPAPGLVRERRDEIRAYWDVLRRTYPRAFDRELALTLVGTGPAQAEPEAWIGALADKCAYLIEQRGFAAWDG